jgi:hypothetical protein
MSTATVSRLAAASLTQAQRHALELMAAGRIVRVTGGWRGRGTPLIRISTAQALIAHELAYISVDDGRRQILPTSAGRLILRKGGN